MNPPVKRSIILIGLMLLVFIGVFGFRYALLKQYLAAGTWGAVLFVMALCGGALAVARASQAPLKATVAAFALVVLVGLATASGPLPYELAKMADAVPVPPGAAKMQTISGFHEPFAHNSATARYVYPAGTNATHLFNETKRLVEADGWKMSMVNPPWPVDSSSPEGTLHAEKGGFWVLLHFTYNGTQGAPPVLLAVTVSGP